MNTLKQLEKMTEEERTEDFAKCIDVPVEVVKAFEKAINDICSDEKLIRTK